MSEICVILQYMKLRYYILFAFLILSKFGFSNNILEKPDFEPWETNSNPYNVIYNQQYYLQKEEYSPEKSGKSFEGNSASQKRVITIKFKQLLDGKGILLNLKNIPHNPDYLDSVSMRNIYFIDGLNQKVWIEKKGRKWMIGEESQKAIIKMHKEVYPFGSDFILNLMPYTGGNFILGLKIWQWIGLLILVGLSLIIEYYSTHFN